MRNRIITSWLTAINTLTPLESNKLVALIDGCSTCTRTTPGGGFAESSFFCSSLAACWTLSIGPGPAPRRRSKSVAIFRAPSGS